MKKIFLPFLLFLLVLSSAGCIKDTSCTPKTPQSEQATIQNFAAANSIIATQHSTGLYYEILNPGSGPAPNITSTIRVTYTGKLLDGTVIDSGTTPAEGWPLAGLIQGWQVGIPLIAEGGVIKLIVPSSMAYGCSGLGPVPGDAILYFEVTLIDVL